MVLEAFILIYTVYMYNNSLLCYSIYSTIVYIFMYETLLVVI